MYHDARSAERQILTVLLDVVSLHRSVSELQTTSAVPSRRILVSETFVCEPQAVCAVQTASYLHVTAALQIVNSVTRCTDVRDS